MSGCCLHGLFMFSPLEGVLTLLFTAWWTSSFSLPLSKDARSIQILSFSKSSDNTKLFCYKEKFCIQYLTENNLSLICKRSLEVSVCILKEERSVWELKNETKLNKPLFKMNWSVSGFCSFGWIPVSIFDLHASTVPASQYCIIPPLPHDAGSNRALGQI